MSAPEIWRHAFPVAGRTAALAERIEALGFDGLLLADSQNLEGDVYVELALAAGATERIRLGVGVTNPLTRHAAVTASAIATVQVAVSYTHLRAHETKANLVCRLLLE